MTNPGRSRHTEVAVRDAQRTGAERAKLNNTAAPAEVASLFAPVDVVEQNAYHWRTYGDGSKDAVTKLLKAPVSPDFARRYDGRLHFLTQNGADFGPEEDIIDADAITVSLAFRTRDDNPTVRQEAMDALRARRVVVATLGHMGLSAERPADPPAMQGGAEQAAVPQEITFTVQLGALAAGNTRSNSVQ